MWVYLHPQSFETSGHLVQLWQSKKGLRERKFENSAKTDGRERIHHFLQQSYCVTKQQIIPIKRVILVIVMMGKLSARA